MKTLTSIAAVAASALVLAVGLTPVTLFGAGDAPGIDAVAHAMVPGAMPPNHSPPPPPPVPPRPPPPRPRPPATPST